MEKIILNTGEEKCFITNENDVWKFYFCDTYSEAKDLEKTLTAQGYYCEVADCRRGWYVRLKK